MFLFADFQMCDVLMWVIYQWFLLFLFVSFITCLFSVLWCVCSVMWAHQSELKKSKNVTKSLWYLHIIPRKLLCLILIQKVFRGWCEELWFMHYQIFVSVISVTFALVILFTSSWRIYIACDVCWLHKCFCLLISKCVMC